MSVFNQTYRWLDDDGAAFGAPGLEPRWTSSKKDAVSTAYCRLQPHLVHRLPRHPQRNLLPHHRPPADARHGAALHRRGDLLPRREARLRVRLPLHRPRRARRSRRRQRSRRPLHRHQGVHHRSRTTPSSSCTSRSRATRRCSRSSSATPCSRRTSTAAAPATPPAPSTSPAAAPSSRGRTASRSPSAADCGFQPHQLRLRRLQRRLSGPLRITTA